MLTLRRLGHMWQWPRWQTVTKFAEFVAKWVTPNNTMRNICSPTRARNLTPADTATKHSMILATELNMNGKCMNFNIYNEINVCFELNWVGLLYSCSSETMLGGKKCGIIILYYIPRLGHLLKMIESVGFVEKSAQLKKIFTSICWLILGRSHMAVDIVMSLLVILVIESNMKEEYMKTLINNWMKWLYITGVTNWWVFMPFMW